MGTGHVVTSAKTYQFPDYDIYRWNIGQMKALARLRAVLERLYIQMVSQRTAPDSTLPDPKRIDVEYEWLPQRCKSCCSLGHVSATCPANMKKNVAPPLTIFVQKQLPKLDPKQPEQRVKSMEDRRPAPTSGMDSAGPEHPQSTAGNSGSSGLNKGKDIVLHNSYNALAILEDAETRVSLANVQRTRRNLLKNWSWFEDYSGPAGRIWLAWDSLEVGIDVLEDEPWLILGDFNAVMDDSEVCGQAADTSASMAEFRSCIRDTGLVTLPFTGCPFTWHNCSEGPRSLWKRLDRMLANGTWLDVWPGFLGSVENIWKHHIPGTAMYEIVCKLKLLKAEFKRQTKRTGELSVNVRKAKDFLDKAQTLFSTYKEDIYLTLVKCCRRVYAGAVKLEISMLQQRAKLRWLKHGDQNSKVFFRKINLTRAKQRVFQIAKQVHDIRQITPAEASLLVAAVTAAEVKEAFFDIEVESAPGPDGFGSAFYRAAWPVVGQSMLEAVVNMPTYVSDYRPIACCNVLYKAITKIIVKRIQRVLPLLINYSQNAFVPGRSISDNILLAQELLAGYNQTRLPERCTIKVDIQKAYDSVEWDFLLEVLRLFNFPTHFINLIVQCVSTASFSVSLNGAIHGKGGRGLRQVNPSKSQIIFSRAVQQRQQILDCVGFHEGSLPIKYLGIPLTSSRLTLADCRPLTDKVDARLAGWNHQNLSYAGRLQLIKSVLSTLHMYWASVFILPKGVLKMLERKMRTFLWQGPSGGRQAKVAWDQICKPKAEGGLGMRSLIIMNQALILKQMWRILQNDGSSIWVDWIQRYRLRHSTLWTFNRTTGSWCWKKMLKLRPILRRGVNYKVGDGSSFSLWQDVWHERGPLCLNFPRGIEVTGLPLSSTLSSVLQRNQWCWPAATDSDIAEIISLLPSTNPSTVDAICGEATRFSESHDHLFFKCWFSKRCLTILKHKIRFPWPYLEWKRGIIWASKRLRGNHFVNAALRATLAALVYHIWAERNSRKFAATASSAERVSNRVLEDIRMRILAADIPPSLQTRSLYRIWKLAWPLGQ
ncbi:UNVERIFIED_CONTAM: hypothetical protein Scaly_3118000 [Sesamum calycinum]|uniref:Reverse transcriptase domain-containing protein n=1 Tax=Sesamum calycinum TaxID=2727403 RepID=A0AAW2JJK1_9LAMI